MLNAQAQQQGAQQVVDPYRTVGGHDFNPVVYDPADFEPYRKCRNCGARFKNDDIRGKALIPNCAQALNKWVGPVPRPLPGKAFRPLETSGPTTQVKLSDHCECGAHRALGCGRKQSGHSTWCPWAP